MFPNSCEFSYGLDLLLLLAGEFRSHLFFVLAGFRSELCAEIFGFEDAADFDIGVGAWVRMGAAFDPFGRFFERLALPHPEAGNEFLGFGEGAVDDGAFVALEFDAGAHRAGPQAFAREHGRHEPLVRVTLVDGERFFLASLEEHPGDGFVTLRPHPEHYGDMVQGERGDMLVPRVLVVPRQSIQKMELLASTPRGTRSLMGFRLPK